MNMSTIVQPDRVLIGPEFVPRRFDLPQSKQVLAGETYTHADGEVWDYFEIQMGGTAVWPRDVDTTVKATHYLVLPGGTLDMGTMADPIRAKATLIIRDVPIDFSRDPFQWGNGLLNFGMQSRVGQMKMSCSDLTVGLVAGQTKIPLPEVPTGWQIGDEVLIPDTQMQDENHFPQRESPVFIAALDGKELTLSKGLDFDHPPITGPDGTVYAYACVCNLTRNVIIASEQPDPSKGTPGHSVDPGGDTHWELQSNLLIGLGRTTTARIDKTSLDLSHIGTNEIARYGTHKHHAFGLGSFEKNCVIRGNRDLAPTGKGAKWGLVIHATHDSLIEDNIVIDYTGSGVITEDGVEVRNVFRKNIAMYCYESIQTDNTVSNLTPTKPGLTDSRPGTEGSGFWFHGVQNTFEENESRCNRNGFVLVNQLLNPGTYPPTPGADEIPYGGDFARNAEPISNKGNLTLANFLSGHETWAVGLPVIDDMVSAYQGNVQYMNFSSGSPTLNNPTLIGKNGISEGLHCGMAYSPGLTVNGGVIAGCATGLAQGGGAGDTIFNGTVFQCAENMDFRFSGSRVFWNGVIFKPLEGFPPRDIVLGDGRVWNGELPLPFDGASHLPPCRGSQYFVRSHQGVEGQDFLLFHNQQLGSNPAPYTMSDTPQHAYALPETGLTVQEGWEKYGLAYRGESLADVDKIALPGLINGYARVGLTTVLGAPGAVLMSPTMREPAPVLASGVKMYVALTGDPDQADSLLYFSFDGGAINTWGQQPGTPLDDREFFGPFTEGTHTLTLWRKGPSGQGPFLPGSKSEWQYFVGATPELVTVPNVVGQDVPTATTTLIAAGLTLGQQGSQHDPVITNGLILSQSPAAGLQIIAGASVNVIISLGPAPMLAVPNLIGMTKTDAATLIVIDGFVVGTVTSVHDAAPVDQVIGQSPTGGTLAESGSAIDLTISLGIVVPPPTGLLQPGTYTLTNEAGVSSTMVVAQ